MKKVGKYAVYDITKKRTRNDLILVVKLLKYNKERHDYRSRILLSSDKFWFSATHKIWHFNAYSINNYFKLVKTREHAMAMVV